MTATAAESAPPGPPPPIPQGEGGRTFPCPSCGGDLVFAIGADHLTCPHCGVRQELALDPEARIAEQDLAGALARLAAGHHEVLPNGIELDCRGCGATVAFTGALTATECAFCGTPLQREDVHRATERLAVDGVLPFRVDHQSAAVTLRKWVASRWFAPGEFKRRGVRGRFAGVFLPFWTFDSMTSTVWQGQRGDAYWVEVGSGKNRRRERRVSWTRVSGSFQCFFDDVVVGAASALPDQLMVALEPWPLAELRPFAESYLAGFQARTYDIALDAGFATGKLRMEAALRADVRRRIGGDEQRIDSMDVRFDALTYKHLLLPLWLMSYQFHDKTFQVAVNATTGELVGERPWSWVKIGLAVLAVLLVVLLVVVMAEGGGG